uniref:G patch domain-containing protein n=1 Tax=Percolomonas cosmopolitus TaxID=63605 RepID=A0A7S1PIE2_9EUKA
MPRPLGTPLFDPKTNLPTTSENNYVPQHLQIATTKDPKTQKEVRRFHGAFTGGFSAGYYNTVGSKEGWKPKNFVISRRDRKDDAIQQDITDYMDEEDRRDILGDRRLVRTEGFENAVTTVGRGTSTTSGSNQINKTQSEMSRGHVNLFGDLMEEGAAARTTEPSRSSVTGILDASVPTGERLLRRMGWRGQEAIGNLNATQTRRRVGPAALPPMSASQNEAIQMEDEHTFIRIKDTPMPEIPFKNDWHGIGYISNSLSLIDLQGAAQDDDPYSRSNVIKMSDALSGTNRQLSSLPQKRTLSHIEPKKDTAEQYDQNIPTSSSVPMFIPRKRRKTIKSRDEEGEETNSPVSAIKDFIDAPGPLTWNPKEMLEEDRLDKHKSLFRGFHLSRIPENTAKFFPPPIVPTDFNEIVQMDKITGILQPRQSSAGRLSSESRGQTLGEERIPSKFANIMKNLTPEQRVSVLRSQQKTHHFQNSETQELQKKLSRAMSERFSINFSSKDSPKTEKTNPYEEAAKHNIYGNATRETVQWKPSRKLTNALGLTKEEKKQKESDGSSEIASDTRTKRDVSIFSKEIFPSNNDDSIAPSPAPPQPEAPQNEERPPIDIFKAIFEDSDDEDFIASVPNAQPVVVESAALKVSINKGFEMFDEIQNTTKQTNTTGSIPGSTVPATATINNVVPFAGVPSLGSEVDLDIAIQPQSQSSSLKIKKRQKKSKLRKR